MIPIVRWTRTCLAACVATFALVASLSAQGITTAALRGRVVDDTGAPVEGAEISLVNTSTGQRFAGISRGRGLFNIENVPVGGPYVLEATHIGYQPARRTGITLSLGQILELTLEMPRAAVELAELVVTAEQQDPLTAPSRTGTAAFVSDSAIRRLPTLNRNFTDFVITAPQVAEADGLVLGGQHRKMNNIQIDGVSNNDLFGLGDTGQPGGQVGAKSITIEAVKEYQVVIAPFDVRQSGFAGGLVNAVTKRGTNQFRASAFWYYQSDALLRDTVVFARAPGDTLRFAFGEYLQHQRGFSFGGPLVRDKVHFFGAAEWQTREVPVGLAIGRDPIAAVGIRPDSARRVTEILRNKYGISLDPATYGPLTTETPNRNLFGRVDVQLGENHTLTLRHNHVLASGDAVPRTSASFYGFSSFNRTIRNTTNSAVAQLNSTLGGGRYYNELRVGYSWIRDRRVPEDLLTRSWPEIRPQLEIRTNSVIDGRTVFNQFVLGGERFSQRNELDQDIIELDNTLTFARGAHTITVGTHNEWIHFRNLFHHTADGQWRFSSLADFEAGRASLYFVQIPYSDQAAGRPGTFSRGLNEANWSLVQLGAYVQDQWEVTPQLRITAGLRFDVPVILDEPIYNPDVDNAFAALGGLRTDRMPSGNIHWAPRFGFNWDVTRDRGTVVRGGAGIFTGRPPYVWLSNAFSNTGREVLEISCTGGNTPVFTAAALKTPPTQCRTPGPARAPVAQVNVFDPDFKFPQTLKASVAVDQRLPWGVVGTAEFLYLKGVNTILQQELTIQRQAIRRNAEGRQMFGTVDPRTGIATPQRVATGLGQVLDHTNASRDYSYSVTLQLQKRFRQGYEFNAGYTFTTMRDLTSLTSSIATSNFGFNPVSRGENPNDPELAASNWEVPHKLTFSGTVDLPIPGVPTSLTLIYTGQSGAPYTWTVDGDANADGYEAANISGRNNDIPYVPRSAAEFSQWRAGEYAKFEELIQSEACLREARGTIPARNTCRNPWRTRLDASLRASLGRAFGGAYHNVSLVVDIFNLPNLLNEEWGLVKFVHFGANPAIELMGYDTANDRGIYRYIGPTPQAKTRIDATLSRWRMQIALRYDL